jgi:hypothetical protein
MIITNIQKKKSNQEISHKSILNNASSNIHEKTSLEDLVEYIESGNSIYNSLQKITFEQQITLAESGLYYNDLLRLNNQKIDLILIGKNYFSECYFHPSRSKNVILTALDVFGATEFLSMFNGFDYNLFDINISLYLIKEGYNINYFINIKNPIIQKALIQYSILNKDGEFFNDKIRLDYLIYQVENIILDRFTLEKLSIDDKLFLIKNGLYLDNITEEYNPILNTALIESGYHSNAMYHIKNSNSCIIKCIETFGGANFLIENKQLNYATLSTNIALALIQNGVNPLIFLKHSDIKIKNILVENELINKDYKIDKKSEHYLEHLKMILIRDKYNLDSLDMEDKLLLLNNSLFQELFFVQYNEKFNMILMDQGFHKQEFLNIKQSKKTIIRALEFYEALNFIEENGEVKIHELSEELILALLKNNLDPELLDDIDNENIEVYMIENSKVELEDYEHGESIPIKKALLKQDKDILNWSDILGCEELSLFYIDFASLEDLENIFDSSDSNIKVKQACLLKGYGSESDFDDTDNNILFFDIDFRIKCIELNINVTNIAKQHYKCRKTLNCLIKNGYGEQVIHEEYVEDELLTITIYEQSLFLFDDLLLDSLLEFNQSILIEYNNSFTKKQLIKIVKLATCPSLIDHIEKNYNLKGNLNLLLKNSKILSV